MLSIFSEHTLVNYDFLKAFYLEVLLGLTPFSSPSPPRLTNPSNHGPLIGILPGGDHPPNLTSPESDSVFPPTALISPPL